MNRSPGAPWLINTVGEKCEFDGRLAGWLDGVHSEMIVIRKRAVGAEGSGLVDT